MNLFDKYGIREVADVTFYSITKIGKEVIYTPVLFLDTLKISTLSEKVEKAEAKGGEGNHRLVTWNFGRDITLKLEDALFTPASMSLLMSGELKARLSPYISIITKSKIANEYFTLNYSPKAFSSPSFTEEEWDLFFQCIQNLFTKSKYWSQKYEDFRDDAGIEEARVIFKNNYFNRKNIPVPEEYMKEVFNQIENIKQISQTEVQIHEPEYIDRFEKCYVTNRAGLLISTKHQQENLYRHYTNDMSCSYQIYYDVHTMQPLLNITDDGEIVGWKDGAHDLNRDYQTDQDTFCLKMGTPYYKFTRTIKHKKTDDNSVLGKTYVIDADTFPGEYKIVGETYMRSQQTGKDEHCQFVINRAQITPDTNIKMEATGDPTVFDMTISVLADDVDTDMIELKEFDTSEDRVNGGTYIVPRGTFYPHTRVDIPVIEKVADSNDEIY